MRHVHSMGKKQNVRRHWLENLNEGEYLVDISRNCRIILKVYLKKIYERMWLDSSGLH
jgi:hypothetical protein